MSIRKIRSHLAQSSSPGDSDLCIPILGLKHSLPIYPHVEQVCVGSHVEECHPTDVRGPKAG